MTQELTGIVVLFGAALVVAWLMRVLRAPTILGFLLAGMLIGPHGLGWIRAGDDLEQVRFFAELGLALLLFAVGLELSPAPLVRSGPRMVGAMLIQMGLTAIAVAALVHTFLPLTWWSSAVVGCAVAPSCSAIVLKHLSDQRETDSPAGSVIVGVQLLQDIAVILLLVLLPLVAQPGDTPPAWVAAKIVLALGGLAVVTLVARALMPWIVTIVFRHGGRDVLSLFAIVMASLGAWLAGLAGWSWGLGSFLAGVLLAQTSLRHQLHAEISPFRDAFNALFFMAIGMLVNFELVTAQFLPLSVAILLTLVGKAVLAGSAVVAMGWPTRIGIIAGLGMATISEFGYVFAAAAADHDPPLISREFLSFFVAWTVGTMLLGSLLVPIASPLANWWGRRRRGAALAALQHAPRWNNHVIVVGYGVNGKNLAMVLKATRIPRVVVEMGRYLADAAQRDGVEIVVGDATRMAILEEAGLSTARALVTCIDDHHATRSIVAQAHAARPELYILARTRHVSELEILRRLGAREAIPEEFETSIEIFAHVLKEFAVPDNVIDQQISMIRAGQYGMLRGRTSIDRSIRSEWIQLLEAALTQTFLVMEGSPAAGKTVQEMNLRAVTGVTIVAVTRGGKPIPNPPLEFRVQVNDVLVLVGTHRELDAARVYLSPPEPPPGDSAETDSA